MPGLAHHLLMLYGPDIPNFFRRAVSYADKLHIRSVTINLQTSMLLAYGQQIAASALEKRLPTVYGYRCHCRGTYQLRRRFALVLLPSGLLRGQNFARTAPGDLPVEFPTRCFWRSI